MTETKRYPRNEEAFEYFYSIEQDRFGDWMWKWYAPAGFEGIARVAFETELGATRDALEDWLTSGGEDWHQLTRELYERIEEIERELGENLSKVAMK